MRIKVIAAAAVVGLVGAGGAFAYWTFGGTGTDKATVAANPTSAIVVSQTTAINNLAPGMRVDLAGLLTNPNVTDVKVGTLTAAISVPAGVALSDFSLAGNPQVINQVVKLGTPVPWSGMSLAYANSAVNQDNAKNVPVTLTYTLTPFVEPPVVVPPTATLVNGVLTVNYTNAAYPGGAGSYTAWLTDGSVNFLGFPVREYLPLSGAGVVSSAPVTVTAFPVVVGNTYTFGIALGSNAPVFTFPVLAQ